MSFARRKIPKHLILEEYSTKKPFGFGWLLFAFGLLVGSMTISMLSKANDLYETKAGQLLFQNAQGMYDASLHLHSKAEVEINGMIAHVTLSQTFSNHTDQWREGIYVFPLPENAAVNHMEMRIGKRVIVGEIQEKQQARLTYKAAKRSGKRAALTEQKRPNVFTQRVANIAPQQDVAISITYIHTTDYHESEFSWRFPMTITPRYSPPVMPTRHEISTEKKTLPQTVLQMRSRRFIFHRIALG